MINRHNHLRASASLFIILLIATQSMALAQIRAEKVTFPIQGINRLAKTSGNVDALLWSAKSGHRMESNAIIIVHGPKKMTQGWVTLGAAMAERGFNTLAITAQLNSTTNQSHLLEEIQSAVVFLKTEKSIKAKKIAFICSDDGAAGCTQYASASRQMSLLVDSLILLSPNDSGSAMVPKIHGIPVIALPHGRDGIQPDFVVKFLANPWLEAQKMNGKNG